MMKLVIKTNPSDIGKTPKLLRSKKYDELLLDLSTEKFIDSLALAQWKCLVELALELNIKVNIVPPTGNALHYAGRMGLFEKTNYVYPFQKNQPETFFPLVRIENDRNDNLYEECQRVFGMSNISVTYVNRLADAFTELADNIYYHSGQSQNSGWGYVHAQVYEKGHLFWKKGCIRIGVADVGIGFYGSYERTNQVRNRTERQILLDAFKVGESSLNPFPKPGYRGIGINEVFGFIQHFSGIMVISSGNATVMATSQGLKDSDLSYTVGGTWIKLEVPIL